MLPIRAFAPAIRAVGLPLWEQPWRMSLPQKQAIFLLVKKVFSLPLLPCIDARSEKRGKRIGSGG